MVAGQYRDKLSNGGERIALTFGQNLTIQDFAYSDAWQVRTDGGGHSLEIIDPAGRRAVGARPPLGARALSTSAHRGASRPPARRPPVRRLGPVLARSDGFVAL